MKQVCLSLTTAVVFLSSVLTTGASPAWARPFSVTITNLTKGQTFTPPIIVSHKAGFQVFEAGTPASVELESIAEGGDTNPLAMFLQGAADVRDIVQGDALIGPGMSATFTIDVRFSSSSDKRFNRVSVVTMLIPTNDTFIALDGFKVRHDRAETVFLRAYDAGTEVNDEDCDNIPGPQCAAIDTASAGEGFNADRSGAEGVIYVGNGINGIGDLSQATYTWNNPVAGIVLGQP